MIWVPVGHLDARARDHLLDHGIEPGTVASWAWATRDPRHDVVEHYTLGVYTETKIPPLRVATPPTRTGACRARHHRYGRCERHASHVEGGGDHRGSDGGTRPGTYWPRARPEQQWKIRATTTVATDGTGRFLCIMRVWSITPPAGGVETVRYAFTQASAIAYVTDQTKP